MRVSAKHLPPRELPNVADRLQTFLTEARTQIAGFGPGFPRLELRQLPSGAPEDPASAQVDPSSRRATESADADATGRCVTISGSSLYLNLSLRTLPALGSHLSFRTLQCEDTGIHPCQAHDEQHPDNGSAPSHCDPTVKGPHIALFAELNRELGAEALLTDTSGHVLEGATTSLVWWHGAQGYVSASAARVPSVTESLLRQVSAHIGTPFLPSLMTPAEIAACEVWAVNALHGIRVVDTIDHVSLPLPQARRLHDFAAALDHTWEPVCSSQP